MLLYAGIMSHGTGRDTGSLYCEARYRLSPGPGGAVRGGFAPGARLGEGVPGALPDAVPLRPSQVGAHGAGPAEREGEGSEGTGGHVAESATDAAADGHGGHMGHEGHEMGGGRGRNAAEKLSSPHGGSFRGHAGPFAMFTVWGAYWALAMSRLWMLSRRGLCEGMGDLCLSQPWFFAWGNNAIGRGFRHGEPIMKVALATVAAWSEIYFHPVDDICYHSLIGRDGFFDMETVNLWVHALMYGGFAFSGVVDLLAERSWLPQGWARAAHLVAFGNTAFMFSMHLGGSEVNTKMHELLLLIFLAYIGVTLADFAFVTCHSLSLMRPGLLFLLGSWFLQVGVASFGTDNNVGPVAPWDHQRHQTGMAVPIVFAFHVFGDFALYGCFLIAAQAFTAPRPGVRGLLQPLEKHEHAYFVLRAPGGAPRGPARGPAPAPGPAAPRRLED